MPNVVARDVVVHRYTDLTDLESLFATTVDIDLLTQILAPENDNMNGTFTLDDISVVSGEGEVYSKITNTRKDFTYSPAEGETSGEAVVEYTITDINGETSTGRVTFLIGTHEELTGRPLPTFSSGQPNLAEIARGLEDEVYGSDADESATTQAGEAIVVDVIQDSELDDGRTLFVHGSFSPGLEDTILITGENGLTGDEVGKVEFDPDNPENLIFTPAEGYVGEARIHYTVASGATDDYSQERSVLTVDVVCFAKGTHIAVAEGERKVEALKVGDWVQTMDHGLRQIRWIGSKRVTADKRLAPIIVPKGAMGNKRDLALSPQHRIFLSDWRAELLFGESDVLVSAKHLSEVSDITHQRVGGEVEYYHILFDTHEIIFSEGIPTESYHPGEQGVASLSQEARRELFELFPELSAYDFKSYGPTARRVLKKHEVSSLFS